LAEGSQISKKAAETVHKWAVLVLEDGTVFRSKGFGASKKVYGEVVFNTGMVGYPEAITDPSYKGQILVQTYPLIGNYGVTTSAFESDGPKIEGYVVHELCKKPSHWSSEMTLDSWLEANGIPGIEGIDTRMLTKRLRIRGTMLGILRVYDDADEDRVEELKEEVKKLVHPDTMKLAYAVATDRIKRFDVDGDEDVALIDCGVKLNIVRNIMDRKYNVVLVPPRTTASEILDMSPAAVVLSNGPGDPKMCGEVIESVQGLIEAKIPILGICLGNQILALSMGADTYKLKFGHRGQNHPCIDLSTGRCYITSQNHGYAVDEASLRKTGLMVMLINANDKTVEGIEHEKLPIRAVQFHPEASPGPNDSNFYFDAFFAEVAKKRGNP